jgi:hypothetical protein
MSLPSFRDAFGLPPEPVSTDKIKASDLVRTGLNAWPCYRVVAVAADRAWLRDISTGADVIARTDRCRLG